MSNNTNEMKGLSSLGWCHREIGRLVLVCPYFSILSRSSQVTFIHIAQLKTSWVVSKFFPVELNTFTIKTGTEEQMQRFWKRRSNKSKRIKKSDRWAKAKTNINRKKRWASFSNEVKKNLRRNFFWTPLPVDLGNKLGIHESFLIWDLFWTSEEFQNAK